MIYFKIYIDLENAAFRGHLCGLEVSEILVKAAKHFKRVHWADMEGHGMNLYDSNGNAVGFAEAEVEDEDEDKDEGDEE